jgi:hypothetical protein
MTMVYLYYFINHTRKHICIFNNSRPVFLELERTCSTVKSWSLGHEIIVEADRAHIDYLIIQRGYEFLG